MAEDKENVSNEGEETAKVGDNHIEAGKRPKAKKNGENPNSAEDSDSKDSNTGMPEFKRPRKDESPVRKSLDLDCKKQSANIANDIPSPTVNNSTSPNGVIQNGEHQHNAGNGGAGERHLELIQTLVSECETVVMGRSPVRNHPIKSREAEDAGSNQLTKESPATERMHTKSESLNEEETVFKVRCL